MKKMNKRVIYTSIFGGYDELVEPEFKPTGWDFVCFTDRDFTSETWEIRKSIPLYSDNTRNARRYKLLPHRFLSNYDISIWTDGNIITVGDVNNLITTYLQNSTMVNFDHMQCGAYDMRNCIYDEAKTILDAGDMWISRTPERGKKCYKDNPDLIRKQMDRYNKDGYPKQNGLISSGVLVRKHNEIDVIEISENWWEEVKSGSKRDQLSFNYVAWRNNFNINYMRGDIRNNEYFILPGPHKGKK
jgi:hypothetical protein